MSGGKRSGAGRKPASPAMKKVPISLKLPQWLIDRMGEESESRAVLIETALRRVHGWHPPD